MKRMFCYSPALSEFSVFRTLAFAIVFGSLPLIGCSGNSGDNAADGPATVANDPVAVSPEKVNEPAEPVPAPLPVNVVTNDRPPADENGTESNIPTPSPDVPLTPPHVALSVGHQKTCLVNVGDILPGITLPDSNGQDWSLADLYGSKLTVVLFWTLGHPYAREQFERLAAEVAGPYGEYGLRVITVDNGDTPEAVRTAAEEIEADFPVLLDVDGAALASVATKKLPRSYLLDSSGQILWFDIEYSESTRRELNNAILWYLTKEPIIATR